MSALLKFCLSQSGAFSGQAHGDHLSDPDIGEASGGRVNRQELIELFHDHLRGDVSADFRA